MTDAQSFAFGMLWEILWALILGWQFTLGEFVGGPLMIVLLALAFRTLLRPGLVAEAHANAERGAPGGMEGHADMDISIRETGSLWFEWSKLGASHQQGPEGLACTNRLRPKAVDAFKKEGEDTTDTDFKPITVTLKAVGA